MLTFSLPSNVAKKGYGFYRVENKLEDLQKAVGGYIEVITLSDTLVMIIDEEGKIKNKRNNMLACTIYDYFFPNNFDVIVGDALLVNSNGEEFENLSMENYNLIMRILRERHL